MRRTVPLATLLALSLGVFAACGGDDDDASGTPEDTGTTQGDTESTEGTEAPPDEGEGEGEGEGGNGGGSTVTVVGEDIEWTEDSYTATAGEVAFVLENNDSIRHTLVIDGIDEGTFKLEVDSEGDTDEGSVELEAGDYEIFCDVPGHASMRATLTVE